jgi:hypothetical protein
MPDHLSIAPLHRQVGRLSRQELIGRLQAVRALSAARGLRFLDDRSRPRTIELAFTPWVLTPTQLAFFQRLTLTMAGALMRLPALYAAHEAIRRILPFDAAQESWIRLASHPRSRPTAVIGRLDSTATFAHAGWRRQFQFLEPNAVGVGGVHYAPAACSVILDALGDVLGRAFPGATIVPTPDPRRLLLDELTRVARRLDRPIRRVALIENDDYTTGTDEFGSLARHLSQQGLKALVADPRQLRLSNGRLMAKDLEIDLIYRDCELSEFIEMEAGGKRLAALRRAIQDGRLISGLLWEFDHKSSWEVFTDPAYARHFTPRQRRLFHRHLPWTRLVRQARVTDPARRRVDLPGYVRRHKDGLVLKPNTLYGGQGVVVGHAATQTLWERTLSKALHGDTRYVVQQRARIGRERFPVLEDGCLREVERHVVSGFFFNSSDVGLVGRFSSNPVVNVSRGGGLLCALMVQ